MCLRLSSGSSFLYRRNKNPLCFNEEYKQRRKRKKHQKDCSDVWWSLEQSRRKEQEEKLTENYQHEISISWRCSWGFSGFGCVGTGVTNWKIASTTCTSILCRLLSRPFFSENCAVRSKPSDSAIKHRSEVPLNTLANDCYPHGMQFGSTPCSWLSVGELWHHHRTPIERTAAQHKCKHQHGVYEFP